MDVKERIVKEAGKLFLENGIKNVSMDYLASSIGLSKRTIYENFRDKEEILNTFILQAKEEREKKLSQIIDKSDNIAEIFIRIIEFHRNKPLNNVKFFEDIYKYYPDIYEQVRKENEKCINQAKKFLLKGIRE